jgi:serine O-acetyltransferase
MKFREFAYLVKSDVCRYTGEVSWRSVARSLVLGESYKFVFWMRVCRYASGHSLLRVSVYPIALLILRHYRYKFGIAIRHQTKIGSGFYIAHFMGIVVASNAVIGRNCNISQGVTIGKANRGANRGFPTIGDNVYIGPGAKIAGGITVGDDVAIGSNCVVTKDVPPGAVYAGIPGKVISQEGSQGYINRTDYGEPPGD